jgi:hypothetical protein
MKGLTNEALSAALANFMGKMNEDKGKAVHMLKYHIMKMYNRAQVYLGTTDIGLLPVSHPGHHSATFGNLHMEVQVIYFLE